MHSIKSLWDIIRRCKPGIKVWGLSGLLVKVFALTIMLFIWLYLYFIIAGYFYNIAVEKGMAYMPHIRDLLVIIGGAGFAGTVSVLAKMLIDNNKDGIPDEFEEEDKK